MPLTRTEIVDALVQRLGAERVTTDEDQLKRSSVDRFRKYEVTCGVFTRPLPAAVVEVTDVQGVVDVLRFANENGVNVIPRTGGSATEGGLETSVENTVVLDGSMMDTVIAIDTYNMQATCQCGVRLETLENRLRELGFTTGHSPQSKPIAQMGGLVATRSIGQFSTLYGGIEDLVVGLEAVFPNGQVARIKNVPRRAAGPDIRSIIIGNEGSLCFITEVTVKIFRYRPENNVFLGYVLDDMETGFEILRSVMVDGYRPSVARLYDPADAAFNFSHFADGRCVLIFMAEGNAPIANATAAGITQIVDRFSGCKQVDSALIETWFNHLNWGPEQIDAEREEIAQTHNIGYTTEVSGPWDKICAIFERARDRIMAEVPDITWVGGHSSHSYINGTNMYFVYYYDVVDCAPSQEAVKYHTPINEIICEEALRLGGSIVHHHGIGKARAPWTKAEHGSAYYLLETLKRSFDPNGVMNAGTVFPQE